MESAGSEPKTAVPDATAVKVLVAGGVGTDTPALVGSVSDIPLLHVEEFFVVGGVADLASVGVDLGRITISPELMLYLFGTSTEDRSWFLWDELSTGALGAIVLADARALEDSAAAVDFFRGRGIPFVVGLDGVQGGRPPEADEVRATLGLAPTVPVRLCGGARRESTKQLLIALVESLMAAARTAPPVTAIR
ncbi:GTP-binding protein [Actinokineospora xionganensis]|uniref:ATP-binding protein n=1 Tax=Actinokineospora xionganensis TaxID=2684470 RepID=A0ABR7L3Y9_9PSEU|nr:ATP-binding protein [Actinokineospora xionganensis]MBC6447384.1 ATP-binding protein [Actinokineospora xionganensis]